MKFTVLTLFPNLVENYFAEGLVHQALKKKLVEINVLNIRAFADDVHRTVDDRAFGGGDGMVMTVGPLERATASLGEGARVVVLTPQGRRWTQSEAEEWATNPKHVALVCGRYAGIDQRFNVKFAQDEISIGDFILNGGELAAMTVIESVVRLRPGVLGNAVSAGRDSFGEGLLECPQFAKPREYAGLKVPAPLLSGHHAQIEAFRRAVALVRTAQLRPDLVDQDCVLTPALEAVDSLPEPELEALGLTRNVLAELRARWN